MQREIPKNSWTKLKKILNNNIRNVTIVSSYLEISSLDFSRMKNNR